MSHLLRALFFAVTLGACTRGPKPMPEAVVPEPAASSSASPTAAFPATPQAAPLPTHSAPTRFEVYRALLRSADLPLGRAKYCENVIGADAGPQPTLGDWVAYNLSVLENGEVTLPVSCKPDAGSWHCRVEFSLRHDPENVLWRWGVAFRLGPDRALDRASVSCIGAG